MYFHCCLRERERNIDWLPPVHTWVRDRAQTGDQTYNLSVMGWHSNWAAPARAVVFLLIAFYLHSSVQDQSFIPSPFIFLLSCTLSSWPHCSSYCLFLNVFTSLSHYVIFKCLIFYAEQGLQFPASVCLLVMLLIVLYPFVFVSGRSTFSISYHAGLVVNSLNLLCLEKSLFFLHV